MKSVLEDIRKKLSEGVYLNEEHIRFSLVGRLLSELKWNIWDPKEVYTEFPAKKSEDNTKVDIALFLKRKKDPAVYIEIKSHTKIDAKNLPNVEIQLRDYNRDNTAVFTIITDGQNWRFYFSQTGGEFADKCYRKVDLINDDPQEIEDNFLNLLSKEKIDNGEARKIAEQYLELTGKRRAIESSLPEANRRIELDPTLSRVQAIKIVMEEDEYSVTEEEILQHLRERVSSEPQIIQSSKIQIQAQKVIPVPTSQSQMGDRTVIKVTINGKVLNGTNALNTFKEALTILGLERVFKVQLKSKFPIIIPNGNVGIYAKGKYSPIGKNFHVYSNNNTIRKKQFLDQIALQLGEPISVEIVPK